MYVNGPEHGSNPGSLDVVAGMCEQTANKTITEPMNMNNTSNDSQTDVILVRDH